jgi:hypothetical protein
METSRGRRADARSGLVGERVLLSLRVADGSTGYYVSETSIDRDKPGRS